MKQYIVATSLILAGTFLGYLLIPSRSPLYPLGSVSNVQGQTTSNIKYRKLGFLPHWNMKQVSSLALSHITDLAYFALELDGNGNIAKMANPREENPGWTGFKKLQQDPRFGSHPITLTIQMLDNDEITSLLASPIKRKTAITNILELATTYNLVGINLDFEPTGQVASSTRDNFTSFVEEFNLEISKKRLNNIELSIDIYPTLVGKQRLWDLPRLAPYVSYVVIMGYDYHYRGSTTAGPVSPLRGATTYFNDDLSTNLGEISHILPPQKIVLGLPFYGYRWSTTSSDKYSLTIGSGKTTPFKDISQLLLDNPESLRWDRNSLTPYLILEKGSDITQIYFDNELSLGLKLDLVTSSGYQGIAIWALGYEDDNSLLWNTIFQKLEK